MVTRHKNRKYRKYRDFLDQDIRLWMDLVDLEATFLSDDVTHGWLKISDWELNNKQPEIQYSFVIRKKNIYMQQLKWKHWSFFNLPVLKIHQDCNKCCNKVRSFQGRPSKLCWHEEIIQSLFYHLIQEATDQMIASLNQAKAWWSLSWGGLKYI